MFCESKNSTLLRFYKFKTKNTQNKNTKNSCLKVSKLIYNAGVLLKKDLKKNTTARVHAKQTKMYILKKSIYSGQVIKILIFVNKNIKYDIIY